MTPGFIIFYGIIALLIFYYLLRDNILIQWILGTGLVVTTAYLFMLFGSYSPSFFVILVWITGGICVGAGGVWNWLLYIEQGGSLGGDVKKPIIAGLINFYWLYYYFTAPLPPPEKRRTPMLFYWTGVTLFIIGGIVGQITSALPA